MDKFRGSVYWVFVFLLSSIGVRAQQVDYDWSGRIYGYSLIYPREMKVDESGSVYMTGDFLGEADFDPSSDTAFLDNPNTASDEVFICKWNEERQFKWVKKIGGTDDCNVIDMAIDDSGTIALVGRFAGTVDFDPGPGTHNMSAVFSNDGFVLKLDSNGQFISAFSIGAFLTQTVQAVTFDHQSNLIIAGVFRDTVDVDPSSGITMLNCAGNSDGFVAKYDQNDSLLWAFGIHGSQTISANHISVDDSNNIAVSGTFNSVVDFDPGTGVSTLNAGSSYDFFVQKLNEEGDFVWVNGIGGSMYGSTIREMECGPTGEIVVAGELDGSFDVDPSSAVHTLSATSTGDDAWLAKYNANGSLDWGYNFGSSGTEQAHDVVIDDQGSVFTVGTFTGETDFDPGPDSAILTPILGANLFVSKLSTDGEFEFVEAIMAIDWSTPYVSWNEVALGNDRSIYLGGNMRQVFDVDPNEDTVTLQSFGSWTVAGYMVKWDQCYSTYEYDAYDCSSVLSPSGNYTWTQSGQYQDTLQNAAGCDSLIRVNVFITSEEDSIQLNACDLYEWPGTSLTLYSSGTYMDTFINGVGCDSIVILDLIVNQSDSTLDTITSCDNYYWSATDSTYTNSGQLEVLLLNDSGCDSIAVLELIITHSTASSDSVFSCSPYFWGASGLSYDTSGIYQYVTNNSIGCDSVITLNLEVGSDSLVTAVSACDSFNWSVNNTSYFTSAFLTEGFTNGNGCDSLVNLDLTILESTSSFLSTAVCDSFFWDATNSYVSDSGYHEVTLTNAVGCDSVASLDLSITNTIYDTLSVSSCGSYYWYATSTLYLTSGTYTTTSASPGGCDSILTLDLTVGQQSFSSPSITACDSFAWVNTMLYSSGVYFDTLINTSGCDSFVTLNLTIVSSPSMTVVKTSCGPYFWPANGQVYNESGSYVSTVSSQGLCDSILTLDLTIQSVNDSVIQYQDTLIAVASGASFVWLDCMNSFSVVSSNSADTFTSAESGYFAVQVTQNGCTDTSDCFLLSGLSSLDQKSSRPTVFPNPSSGLLTISVNETEVLDIEITDVAGRQIESLRRVGPNSIIIEESSGLYMLTLYLSDGGMSRHRIMIVK